MILQIRKSWLVVGAIVVLMTAHRPMLAQNTTTMAATVRVADPTIHSIGFEWDLTGDANHNAKCDVRYRAVGTAQWRTASLLRIDYEGWYGRCCMDDAPCCAASPAPDCSASTGNPGNLNGLYTACPEVTCCEGVPFDINRTYVHAYQSFNMFAGSLMFLDPGTTYDIELSVNDPDGPYAQLQNLSVTTRSIPELKAPTRTLHVIPGNGSGSGMVDDPFQGITAANMNAQPGDLFLLHAGDYSTTALGNIGGGPSGDGMTTAFTLTTSGTPGRYIAWKAAGDGPVTLHSQLEVEADHIWIEGLTFEPNNSSPHGGVRAVYADDPSPDPVADLVVVRNTFHNLRGALSDKGVEWDSRHPQITAANINQHWYVCDNLMYGPQLSYGVELEGLRDSDICYNRIDESNGGQPNLLGGDGISINYSTNIDIYGNDLYHVGDDSFEPDLAYANVRIWRNRSVEPGATFLSFQPQFASPWYVIRNEFLGLSSIPGVRDGSELHKTNVYDRFVQVNNTFVVKGKYLQNRADIFLKTFSRNNLLIHEFHADNNLGGAMLYGLGNAESPNIFQVGGQSMADWKTDVDYDGLDWDASFDASGSCVDSGQFPAFNVFWWGDSIAPNIFHTYNALSCFSSMIGIEAHALRVHRANEFTQDVDTYPNTPFSPDRLTLKAGAASIDAGVMVPNLAEDYLGAAPDLGAYEFGAPPPQYGPRNCGNGMIDPGEQCDDGQPPANGDGCSADCQLEGSPTTPTPTTTPSPTETAIPCVGDCDGGGSVVVNELITLVNIALGTANPSACPDGIPSDTKVDISLIVQAVSNVLSACPKH